METEGWVVLFSGLVGGAVAFLGVRRGIVATREKQDAFEDGRTVLRGNPAVALGAPPWMKLLVAAVCVYGLVNFIVTSGFPATVRSGEPEWPRVASGTSMMFYGTALLVMWVAAQRRSGESDA